MQIERLRALKARRPYHRRHVLWLSEVRERVHKCIVWVFSRVLVVFKERRVLPTRSWARQRHSRLLTVVIGLARKNRRGGSAIELGDGVNDARRDVGAWNGFAFLKNFEGGDPISERRLVLA